MTAQEIRQAMKNANVGYNGPEEEVETLLSMLELCMKQRDEWIRAFYSEENPEFATKHIGNENTGLLELTKGGL